MEKVNLETIEQTSQQEEKEPIENQEINQKSSNEKENSTNREILEHKEYPFFKYEKKLQKIPEHRQVAWGKENLVFDEYYSYEIDWNSIDWERNAEIAIEKGKYPFSIDSARYINENTGLLPNEDRESIKKSIQNLDFSDVRKLGKWQEYKEPGVIHTDKEYRYNKNPNIKYVKNLIITDIIRAISQNNAPDYTFNHVFNGYNTIGKNSRANFRKEILSQKLFDVETILKKFESESDTSEGGLSMRDFIDSLRRLYTGGNFDAFLLIPGSEEKVRDKEDESYLPHLVIAKLISYFEKHQKLPEINSQEFRDIINSKVSTVSYQSSYAQHKEAVREVFEQMKKKNYTIFRPFSLIGNSYQETFRNEKDYRSWGETFSEDKITFCFGENNKMFSAYLKNINSLYKKHPYLIKPDVHYPIKHEFGRNIAMRLTKEECNNFHYGYGRRGDREIKRPEIPVNHIGQHVPETYTVNDAHPYLYWIFNHSDFIDPSWCFAEWAVIPTEKKLRILQPIINEIEKQEKEN